MATTGRPREFEDEEILDIAVELFTENGYSDTSINELLYAFDMGRQSLYNAFGSKNELFLAALDQYAVEDDATMAVLKGADAGFGAIERYFEARVQQLAGARPRHGCLLVNSVIDMGSRDREIERRGQSLVRRMSNAFYKSLRIAAANGDIADVDDLRAHATHLAATSLGLCTIAKSGASTAAMQRAVDAALAGLRRD